MRSDSNRLDGMDASAKRELLARLLRERATGSGQEFELSPGQEALWFVHELAPDSAAYNVAFCARVRSEVNRERLERALLKLMERHSMLRCTIVGSGQALRQRIGPVPQRCLEIVDASGLGDEELKALVEETSARPFDLAAGPAFRCTLFSRCPMEHVLLLSVHHVFSDAWSFGILVRDLTRLYAEDSPTLTPVAADAYAGFVRWIRAIVDSEEGLQAWKYWQARLQNLPSQRLPSDHPRLKRQSFRGASHHFELPAALCDAVRTLARSENATPFMVLAAGLHALLHRYSGSPVVPIITPLAGRSRREDEATVGYFINLVVLCAPVQPGTTFRQHIADIRAAAIGAQRFGEFPFTELVKRFEPVRDTSAMPIFQVMLNVIKASQVAVYKDMAADAHAQRRVGSLVLEAFPLNQGEGQFDLELDLFDPGGAMPAVFKYRTDLFERATVERLAGHFVMLLAAGVADPDRRISDLPLLTEAERNRVVLEWNATTKQYPETTDAYAARGYVAPQGEVETALAGIWTELLRLKQVGVHDNFFDLGGDSLLAVRLIARIERVLGKRVNLVTLFQAPTIRELAAILSGRNYPGQLPGVVQIHAVGSKAPFFWIGATPLFRPLGQRLASGQPFLGLHLQPSQVAQLSIPYKLEEVAACLVSTLKAVQPDGPYYLGGYCLNGLLAYEVARQLKARGENIALLLLVDVSNPARQVAEDSLQASLLLERLRFHLASLRQLEINKVPTYFLTRLWWCVDRARSRILKTAYSLKLYMGKGQLSDPVHIRQVAARTYRPGPYAGHVVFFQTTDNRPVGPQWSPTFGWDGLISGVFEVHDIPADHKSVFGGPPMEYLASQMTTCLLEAQAAWDGEQRIGEVRT